MHHFADAIAQLRALYPAAPARPVFRQLAGFVAGTCVLALFFHFFERLWPEDAAQRRTPREGRIDLFYWFLDSLVARVTFLGGAVVAVTLILLRIPHHPTWVTRQPLWAQAPEALLIGDLTGYWIHRAMHRIPWLWRIHAVHHSSERLNWLAAARVHPLETLIHRALSVAPVFLLGFSPGVVAFFAPFLAIYPIFIHANVRFDYGIFRGIVASPWFHRWHHSSDPAALNSNYAGLLPVWDYLFGTAHITPGRRPENYGLAHGQMPDSVLRQLLWPFR